MGDPIQNLRAVVDRGRRLHQTHRNEWPDLWEAIDKLVGLIDTAYMFTVDQYEPDDEQEVGMAYDPDQSESSEPDKPEPELDEFLVFGVTHEGQSESDQVLVTSEDWSSPSESDKPEPNQVLPFKALYDAIDVGIIEADQWPVTWPQAEKIFIEVTHEDGRAEIMEVMRGQLSEDWSSPEDEVYDIPIITASDRGDSCQVFKAWKKENPDAEDEVKSLPIDIETLALGDAEHWAMWFKAWLEETPDADVDEITLWFARALAVGEVNQHPLIEVTLNDGEVVSMKQAGEWVEDHSLDDPIDPEDSGF